MTKKKRVVVGRSENTGDQVTIRQRKEFLRLEERGQVNKGVMQWIIDNISKIRELAGVKWWECYLIKGQKSLKSFFGKEFDLSLFRKTLEKYGIEQVKKWDSH